MISAASPPAPSKFWVAGKMVVHFSHFRFRLNDGRSLKISVATDSTAYPYLYLFRIHVRGNTHSRVAPNQMSSTSNDAANSYTYVHRSIDMCHV